MTALCGANMKFWVALIFTLCFVVNSSFGQSQKTFSEATVFLNAFDTVHYSIKIRQDFSEHFIEIEGSDQVLPASKIFAIEQDGKFYRSVQLRDNQYVFVQQIFSGEISFYYFNDVYRQWNPAVESNIQSSSGLDYSGENNIWNREGFRTDYFFFFNTKADTISIKQIRNIKKFANQHLRGCQVAYSEAMRITRKTHLFEQIAFPILFAGWASAYVATWGSFGALALLTGLPLTTLYIIRSKYNISRSAVPEDLLTIGRQYDFCLRY